VNEPLKPEQLEYLELKHGEFTRIEVRSLYDSHEHYRERAEKAEAERDVHKRSIVFLEQQAVNAEATKELMVEMLKREIDLLERAERAEADVKILEQNEVAELVYQRERAEKAEATLERVSADRDAAVEESVRRGHRVVKAEAERDYLTVTIRELGLQASCE